RGGHRSRRVEENHPTDEGGVRARADDLLASVLDRGARRAADLSLGLCLLRHLPASRPRRPPERGLGPGRLSPPVPRHAALLLGEAAVAADPGRAPWAG